MNVELSSRVVLDPQVRFRRFDDEGIVIDQKSAEAIVINPVGARLLELFDGQRTLAACCDVIDAEFDASRETIEADAVNFTSELVSSGLARVEP